MHFLSQPENWVILGNIAALIFYGGRIFQKFKAMRAEIAEMRVDIRTIKRGVDERIKENHDDIVKHEKQLAVMESTCVQKTNSWNAVLEGIRTEIQRLYELPRYDRRTTNNP